MDLSKLSTDDLKALQAGDLTKVSTEGLQFLQQASSPQAAAHDRAVADTAAWQQTMNPTNGMSTFDKTRAGIGQGMSSVARGLGQLVGLTDQSDVDAARSTDAPLLSTKSGRVGSLVGKVAATAPTMLIPGANTYTGAALIGAGTGLLTTEGGLEDRAMGAGTGAFGGLLGKGAGDVIGKGANALRTLVASRLAAQQTANASRDAATQAAQGAGYVVTPSQSGRPGAAGSVLEALGGKVKTQQSASVANQQTTNALAARELGLPTDQPITLNALDALRKQAGTAYGDVAGMGTFDAAAAKLPAGTGVSQGYNKLTLAPQTTVEAPALVQAWRQANADATAYYRQYGRDANPETLAKAKAAAADSKTIDDFLTQAVTKQQGRSVDDLVADLARGRISPEDFISQASTNSLVQSGAKPGAAQALKDARVLIAKTHSVENALNPATGDVSAQALAKQLAKGKVLSGGLQQAGEFGQAFPKAAQSGVDVPNYSALDAYSAAEGLGSGNWLQALATMLRAPARSAALSGPVQRGFTQYEPNPLLRYGAQLSNDPRVNALEQLLGTSIGIQAPQQQALQR